MPVVRLRIRSELGLADPAVYRSAPDGDPRSLLDGVAVAGLVGVLRQLGDLAEFAAEVFRGTLEQVEVTTSRCNKIRNRVRNIESALTPIEKAVKVQTTHLHFAYTSGFSWHSKLRIKHKYFNRSGRPRFMVDAYEQCCGPPHLSLLDRFDSCGNGACLKRYSDPSYFKKVHLGSAFSKVERDPKQRKSRHGKKKRSQHKLGVDSDVVSMVSHHTGERLRFTSFDYEMATPRSTMASEPDPSNYSLGSESDKNILWSENLCKSVEDQQYRLPTPMVEIDCVEDNSSQISRRNILQKDLLLGEAKPLSVPWDEDVETSNYTRIRSESVLGDGSVPAEFMPTCHSLSKMNAIPANHEMFDQDDIIFDVINMQESVPHAGCLNENIAEEENYIECATPLKFLAQEETECKTMQKVERQSASDDECVDIAYEDTGQTSNLRTDYSHEKSCIQSYSFSDKDSHPAVWHVNPIEKVHVKVSQAFPLVIDASELKKVCEENGDQFKLEIELHSDVKAEDVTADELAVEMGDQFRDSVCKGSHDSYLDKVSSPPSYQIQPIHLHLVTQMPQRVLDEFSTEDFGDTEIEFKTKEEMKLRSTLNTEKVEIDDRLIHLSNKWNDFPSEASAIPFDGSLDRETLPASCQVDLVEKIHSEVDEIAPHGVGTFSLGDSGEREAECQSKHEIELNTEVENEDYGTADGRMGDRLTDSPAEESCILLDNPMGKEFSLASFHSQPLEEVHAEASQDPPSGNILSTTEDEIEYQPMLEVELQSNLIADELGDEDRLTICIGDPFRDSLDDSYLGEESSPASCQIQSSEKIHVEANQISSLALNSSGLTDFGEHGIECQTKRGAELQSVVKIEDVGTAHEIAAQMDNLFTDFLNEELGILLGSSFDKEASSVSCQVQHLEKVHVKINDMPSPEQALTTTIDLVDVDIELHTKREVESQGGVRFEEAESADGFMVEKDGRLEDPLNEEFSVLYDAIVVKEVSLVSCQIQPSQKIHNEVFRLSTHSHGTGISEACLEKEFECHTKREVETADNFMAHMGDMSICSLEESSILSDSSLGDDLSASNPFQPADDFHIGVSRGSLQALDVFSYKDFDGEEIDCQTKHEVESRSDIKEEIVEIADKCTTHTGHLFADSFCKKLSVLSHSSSDIEDITASCPIQSVENVHLNIAQASPSGICGLSSKDFGEGDVEIQTKREVEFKCGTKTKNIETGDGLGAQMGDLLAENLISEPCISSYGCEGTSMAPSVMSPVESIYPVVILTSCDLEDVGFKDRRRNENEMVCPIKLEVKLQSCVEVEKVEPVDNKTDSPNVNSSSLSYCSLSSSASCPISLEDTKSMQTSSTYLDSYSTTDSSKCSDFLGPLKSRDFSSNDSSKRPDCLGSSTGYFSFGDSGECLDISGSSTRGNFESASLPTSSSVADNMCHTENSTGASIFPAVSIWTNGGLLGLLPSKPPDVSGSDDATKKNHTKPDAAVSEEQAIKPKDVNPYVVFGTRTEQRQTYLEEPSNFSGFTSMFLKSTSWGKASCNKPSECSVASDNALQEEFFHDTPNKLHNESEFSALHDVPVEANFGLPSPTPKNVQFTFCASGLETSKMRLEFFCDSPANSRDGRFPSFRLLPDHSRSCHDTDSDSEDTFCRSSQYMSDDALSDCSELSSEQWDYRECGGSGDHELYDALRSAPSTYLEGSVTEDLIRGSCNSQGHDCGIQLQRIIKNDVLSPSMKDKDQVEDDILEDLLDPT